MERVINMLRLHNLRPRPGSRHRVKRLGDGELKHGLKVEADKVSATAREKIEKAGGTITLREKGAKATGRADASAANEISGEERSGERAPEATGKEESARKPSTKAKSRAKKKTSRKS